MIIRFLCRLLNLYIYQYKDHLGNTRVSFAKNSAGVPETLDTNNYYPFGLNHIGGANSSALGSFYSYKYNGKELQETGFYDFGARFYMPDIARWGVADPLAETTRRISAYNYAMDNPVMFIDPDGRKAYVPMEWTGETSARSGYRPISNDGDIPMIFSRDGGGGGGIPSSFGETKMYQDIMNSLYTPNFGQFDFSQYGVDKDADCPKCPKSSKEITPFELGVEWLSGEGPRSRTFTNGDVMTEMLKKHSNVEIAREKILYNVLHGQKLEGTQSYRLGGIKVVGLYLKDYSTLLTGGLTGNLAVTYLGSYDLNWTAKPNYKNHTVLVEFTVKNSSTMQSASRPPVLGYLPIWQNTAGKIINEKFETGWGSKTTQTIIWTEILKMKRW